MDTFFEQIVAIRKTGKTMLAIVGIWVLFIIVAYALFTLGNIFAMFFSICLLLILLAGWGAFKLTKRFSIEYEYIITNGTFDVDKIIAQSSRKRMMSFEISDVQAVEKFNPSAVPNGNFEKTLFACDMDDPAAYYMIVSKEGKGTRLLVFAPDERIKGAIKKFLPRYMSTSAFN
ncbi:MAG: hypothetical protein IKK24_03810 [Clostridia bacterium]|nr:hypothetical protein [Clostridia bacterium]